MKILHLFSNYKWTGPAEPAVNLAAELKRRGHDVYFASMDPKGSPGSVEQHAAERGLGKIGGLHLNKHFNLLPEMMDAVKLRRIIRDLRPDVVHCHLPNDHLIAALAARKITHRPKIVRTFYEARPLRWGLRTIYLLSKFTDRAIFCSENARQAAAARFLLDAGKTFLIEGAVDTERFDPGRPLPDMRPRFGCKPGDYVIGIVARMQRHRRFDVLLDAVQIAAKQLPDLRMLIIGRGTYKDSVAVEPVVRKGLDGVIKFTDYLSGDDYAGCLKALDVKIFLVPGSDGSCRAAREAMAMGVPVIAANRGMLPEIVTDGETGRVVDDTPENLARAIVELHDAQMRERMSQAARQRGQCDFDLRRQAENVEKIYGS